MTGPAWTGRSWTVALPAGLRLLNANQRLHRHVARPIIAGLRAAGMAAAVQAGVPRLERAHIVGFLYPPDRRRRDVGNWYPSFKAVVDGFVDAGVLPDDDDEHLIGPDMRLGLVERHARLVFVIAELSPGGVAP